MSRRAARLAAVELLYASDVREVPAPELIADAKPDGDGLDPYAEHLVSEVAAKVSHLDSLIGSCARGWTTERMSPVDRNVLRVGALELLEGDVPPAAVIDEAVEIAKRLSGEEAGRFVNGVLEAVRQGIGGAGGAEGGEDGGSGSSSPSPSEGGA